MRDHGARVYIHMHDSEHMYIHMHAIMSSMSKRDVAAYVRVGSSCA